MPLPMNHHPEDPPPPVDGLKLTPIADQLIDELTENDAAVFVLTTWSSVAMPSFADAVYRNVNPLPAVSPLMALAGISNPNSSEPAFETVTLPDDGVVLEPPALAVESSGLDEAFPLYSWAAIDMTQDVLGVTVIVTLPLLPAMA